MYHVFRLEYGADLSDCIIDYCKDHKIKSGVILSGVGCVYELNIRLADGKSILHKKDNYEIVSLMGTISKDGAHLHISFSDINGNVLGGHLNSGCLINTTCEICILELEKYDLSREYDEKTGYDELIIKQK